MTMNDEEIVLYCNKHRLAKLEEFLGKYGSSVEQAMQDLLDKLYLNTVPDEERSEVESIIAAEADAEEKRREAARRFAVVHFHSGDDDVLFTSECRNTFYSIAQLYRKSIRDELDRYTLDSIVSNNFLSYEFISDMMYSVLCDAMPNDQRITALVEFNFDEGYVSVCDTPDSKWRVYSLKDLSNAVYRAERKSGLSLQTRNAIFEESLAGKELYPSPSQDEEPEHELSM